MGAHLEFEVALAAGRVSARLIDFCDTLFVGVKNETAPEDISRALAPFI